MNDDNSESREDIIWIVQPKETVISWYERNGVIEENAFQPDDDNSLVYYESWITNYVAHHSKKFNGKEPRHIWFDLDLYDWRLDTIEIDPLSYPNPESRAKPDLILQFDDELWLIEVKYKHQSPDNEVYPILKTLEPNIEQIDMYRKRLRNLIRLGWFPGVKRPVEIHPVMFWAFWRRRKVKKHLDTNYVSWPVER